VLTKVCASLALAATAAGVAAAPALAAGDGQAVANGNGARSGYGNTKTGGKQSPQMSLIQGTLNKPCIGIGKVGIQSIVALINIGIQDIPILTSQQQQQCVESSTIQDGDDPLSHILSELAVLSGNGSGNSEGKGHGHHGHGHGKGHGGH